MGGATVATVVIPTHRHASTLPYAVESVLNQTVPKLEVFIVGDGVDDATRTAAGALADSDSRVIFFDEAKGQRHGEAMRHKVLQQAQGEIVLYLSDDDLWHSSHVATMHALLQNHDWGHTLPVAVNGAGELFVFTGDVEQEAIRERMLAGENFVPFSHHGHRLDAYRRLPRGWHPAPEELPTDLHFYQQWLSQPNVRVASSHVPTVIHFPSPERTDMSAEQRSEELRRWRSIASDPERWRGLVEDVIARLNSDRVIFDIQHRIARENIAGLQGHIRNLETERDALIAERDRQSTELAQIKSRRTWRIYQRLIRYRWVRALANLR